MIVVWWKDASAINSAYELGDKIKFEEARVAAHPKQTIMEKMRKQTRAGYHNTYKEHEQEISCQVSWTGFDNRFHLSTLKHLRFSIVKQDQIPGEVPLLPTIVSKFIYKVEDNPRGVNVL